VQAKEGLRSLIALPEILERRKKNAHLLTELLSKLGKYHVPAELHMDHAFLKYPILVKDRKQFEDIAVSEKIQLGDWFNSFLHPVQEDFGKWGLNEKDFPVAGDVSGAILNIPCDTIAIDRYLVFLAKYMDELR
jgi:perosamine synthetase